MVASKRHENLMPVACDFDGRYWWMFWLLEISLELGGCSCPVRHLISPHPCRLSPYGRQLATTFPPSISMIEV